jgi:DNA (cytosine-5)-methyltransferase 1
MTFDDKDYYILKQNKISDTQLYKMAGNSIVVRVLEQVFKNLLINN